MNEQNVRNVNEQNLQRIKEHLQSKDAQERIEKRMEDARSKATVTISRAARLFDFSENQLRDWERRFGLLKTDRSSQEGKNTTGHRQYSPAELDKLAIIKELMDHGGFVPADIPPEIDAIWESISREQVAQALKVREDKTEILPINQRIENARAELFWRYYASHALRLALMLICDELPGTTVGLVLPLSPGSAASVTRVEDLPKLGESLIGWLSKTGSSHTLFTPAPSFEYDTDYSLLPLVVMKDDMSLEQPQDKTLIVLDRRDRHSKTLSLSAPVVETIRLLLTPLYEEGLNLRSYFGLGMRDELDPAPNLDSSATRDLILDGLANMVVRLGGRTDDGQDRWSFCCILLPKDPSLPLQQHTLVVQAQSSLSPHKVGGTAVSPDKSVNALSLRAYQSGHVIYRPKVTDTDTSIALHQVEGPVRSALAVPIGWENGSVIAVLYVVSYETAAFSDSYQRVLRMVCRMIEEAILSYRARQQAAMRLTNAIDHPSSVDPLFENFLSESDFVRDVEGLLTALKNPLGEWKEPKHEIVPLDERKARYRAWEATGEVVSFIAVDIDNQSSLAAKHGDQAARNLSKEVGLWIQGQQSYYTNTEYRKVYHIHADRFYLILKGMKLDEARNKAEQLKVALNGTNYRVEARYVSTERLMLPEGKLELSDITVRLGVVSHPYGKLQEILQRYSVETAVADVRAEIMRDLDELLNLGQQEGGNRIKSWDIDSWSYITWSSTGSA